MKKIWIFLNLGIAHFLLFYMAILIITPKNMPLYPIIIWFGMIIFCGLIVQFYWNKTTCNKSGARIRKKYKKAQRWSLYSSFWFLITCISFKKINYVGSSISIFLGCITLISIIVTIIFHIKSIDNKEKSIESGVKSVIKYSWVIASLISFYFARSEISNILDISFDTSHNKLITIVMALIVIFIIYYALYLIVVIILISVSKRRAKLKINYFIASDYSMSICAPLYIIGCISFVAFYMQTFTIFKFGLEIAMKYDTRDTFFCHDKYMLLSEHPDARFMFISVGNYRALIPHDDDFTITRLTCTNNEPFYSLVSVVRKKDLMLTTLKDRTEVLASDLKATMLSDH